MCISWSAQRRLRFSRTQFLRRGALAVGGLAGLRLLAAVPALASSGADPLPIPGGLSSEFAPVPSNPLIHVFPPAAGVELSTITDFNGVVGATEIQGKARGSDGTTYDFDADMRFVQGLYRGTDRRLRQGSFGFI